MAAWRRLRPRGYWLKQAANPRAARLLNAPYLKRIITGMPFVTAKWAMTLDGKTAAASGDSRWISSESSRTLVHEMRGRMDAIVVGIGTAETDDPLLTARPPGPRCPARVVLDSSARLPSSSRLVQTARQSPVIVAVTQCAGRARSATSLTRLGCEVISFPGQGRIPIAELLDRAGPAWNGQRAGGGRRPSLGVLPR